MNSECQAGPACPWARQHQTSSRARVSVSPSGVLAAYSFRSSTSASYNCAVPREISDDHADSRMLARDPFSGTEAREARDERCVWCLPPSRVLPRAPSRAEGGSSGDDSHCPRRTQAVVKVTLRVVMAEVQRRYYSTQSGRPAVRVSGRSFSVPARLGRCLSTPAWLRSKLNCAIEVVRRVRRRPGVVQHLLNYLTDGAEHRRHARRFAEHLPRVVDDMRHYVPRQPALTR